MGRSLIATVAGACLAACAGAAFAQSDYGVLVDRPGVELTYAWCAACHSEMLVAQQGLSRERWDELIDWMVEEQGMPEIPPDEREEILAYLAENYNVDRPNFPTR